MLRLRFKNLYYEHEVRNFLVRGQCVTTSAVVLPVLSNRVCLCASEGKQGRCPTWMGYQEDVHRQS